MIPDTKIQKANMYICPSVLSHCTVYLNSYFHDNITQHHEVCPQLQSNDYKSKHTSCILLDIHTYKNKKNLPLYPSPITFNPHLDSCTQFVMVMLTHDNCVIHTIT